MSRENVEVVQKLFELGPGPVLSGRDLSDLLDPDVEWLPAEQSLLAANRYQGHEGVRQFWADLFSSWHEYLVDPEKTQDFGDKIVVVMRIRARSSRGIEVDERWSGLFTLHDGRIVRFQGFTDPDAALKAVGHSE